MRLRRGTRSTPGRIAAKTALHMPVEARISSIWRKQKLFVAIFFILVSAIFFYDGAISWPKSNRIYVEHQRYVKEHTEAEWAEHAKENGWSATPPHKYYASGDLIGQYVVGGLACTIGMILLIYWATQRKLRLRMDEDAVYSPSGTRVPFDSVTGIGLKNWDSKGVARVRYALDGRKGEFIVDDYKFETEPTRAILQHIEQRLLSRKETGKPE